jgi:hypothetical protein
MVRRIFAVIFFLSSVTSRMAFAQDASVLGAVTDETSAALPGATVSAVELSTGRRFVAVTNEKGGYRPLRGARGAARFFDRCRA